MPVRTSQYEQHLRAILGLPLGSAEQIIPAAMVNLLGEDGYLGPAHYQGMKEVLALPGVYPHLYGKAETRPFRKMGHVTLIDSDPVALKARAKQVADALKVISKQGE